MTQLGVTLVGRPKKEGENMPIRIGSEALKAAKIAASIKGMSLTEYATQVLLEAARRDQEEWVKIKVAADMPAPEQKKEKKK